MTGSCAQCRRACVAYWGLGRCVPRFMGQRLAHRAGVAPPTTLDFRTDLKNVDD